MDSASGDEVEAIIHGGESESARTALVEMVMLDELSFAFTEGVGFRKFCNALQSKFEPISNYIVARDVIMIVSREKAKFMNSDTIGKKIEACLLERNIGGVFTITTDNASSNDTAIRYLVKKTKDWKGTILGHDYLHVRCSAHILNLIVSDGLEERAPSIACIREVVRYVRSSLCRLDSFKKCVLKEKIESKKYLCLDVPTRWNSTYLRLDAAQKFKKAFSRLHKKDSNFKAIFKDDEFSEGEEENENNGAFGGNRGSGRNRGIAKLLKSNDILLFSMALSMKEKLDKYLGQGDKMNLLLYVAEVLDPGKKLDYVKFCFKRLYGKDIAKAMKEKVKNCLVRLFDNCAKHDKNSMEVPNVLEALALASAMTIDDFDDPHKSLASQFSSYMEKRYSILSKSEVD
ncbi:hypothetical protein RHSIM_Rhsim04G0131400 [Rhododendron simsii]|uniref:hAT-like transposase RNase-H fold domain-containing protein n=1 Tax=Rhododendron simsii TaxID=118357 RepID=A0A834H2Z8_RHOSS|nr:hypothetical protein RHSIM_Rhsim04G0131400 [Rhododendron simsii]